MLSQQPALDTAVLHLLDSLADPFFVVNGEWRYTYVNTSVAELMGVRPEDLLGRVLWECFPEVRGTRLEGEYQRVLTSREVRHFEVQYPGLHLWVEVKAFPHGDGIAVHLRDITDRILAHERHGALLTVTGELGKASTELEVARAALQVALPTLGAYGGTVLKLVEHDDVLEVLSAHGYPDPEARDWDRFSLSAALPVTEAAREKGAVFVRERELLTRYPGMWDQKLSATRALAALPLIVEGRVLGVLALSFGADHTFQRGERDFAVALAGQLAQALSRASLQERQAHTTQQLRGLAQAALKINAASDLNTLLDVITAQARQLTGAHQALVSLTGSEDRALSAVSLSDKYAAWRGDDRLPPGGGISTLVRQMNAPLRLTQAELEAHPAWRGFTAPAPDGASLRGWLAVPLVGRDGGNIGLIQLSDKGAGDFSEDDEHVLVQLAQIAAVSVENARQAQELMTRENELHRMADSIAQLAWIADAQGWIYWYNQRWYDYTGTTLEEMRGWGWREVHHPEHVERVLGQVRRAWAAGEPWEDTFLLRGKAGEFRWFLTRAIPLRDEHGKVLKWFGTNTDITEERHLSETLEARVAERTEQLLKSNRELEQFAYVASHDLKAPLRTVTSYVQLLQRKYAGRLDEKADKYITFTVEAVERMNTLIEDLLAFSRVGRQTRVAPVNTSSVVDEVLGNLHGTLQDAGARFTRGPLPDVLADETQLRQVLQNLIANAVKFQPPGRTPQVHLSAETKDAQVHFQVQDNGIGIAPQYFERIFEVFQRLHSREEFSGTGVGLAIVKKIVEEHGGRIWVTSQEQVGTTFHFTLPGVQAAPQ